MESLVNLFNKNIEIIQNRIANRLFDEVQYIDNYTEEEEETSNVVATGELWIDSEQILPDYPNIRFFVEGQGEMIFKQTKATYWDTADITPLHGNVSIDNITLINNDTDEELDLPNEIIGHIEKEANRLLCKVN